MAQEHQLQTDQHKVIENDPDVTDYPANSYALYTPYKALMHGGKLHDYLQEHRMRALIPENTRSNGESLSIFS